MPSSCRPTFCLIALITMGCLLLYDALYIGLLIGVFGLVFCGMTSDRIAVFSKKNIRMTKVLLGLTFFGVSGNSNR